MKRIPSSDPDLVSYAWPGTWLDTFFHSRLWHAVAALLVWMGLQPQAPSWLLFTVAIVCELVAMTRTGWDFNRRDRTYTYWLSIVVPIRTRKGPLSTWHRVVVAPVPQGNEGFLVLLDGSATVSFQRSSSYSHARRKAEGLARALLLPLADHTAAPGPLTMPEHLDECLRDRLRRMGATVAAVPPAPAEARTRIERSHGGLCLSVPAASWAQAALTISPLILLCAVAAAIDLRARNGIATRVCIVISALLVLWARGCSRTIEASASGLDIRWRFLGLPRRVLLPARTVLDVELDRPRRMLKDPKSFLNRVIFDRSPVLIRGTDRTISFGGALPRSEKEWICAVLRAALAA